MGRDSQILFADSLFKGRRHELWREGFLEKFRLSRLPGEARTCADHAFGTPNALRSTGTAEIALCLKKCMFILPEKPLIYMCYCDFLANYEAEILEHLALEHGSELLTEFVIVSYSVDNSLDKGITEV